nr:replication factor A protein 1-like [Ipomoea batatas]
MAPMYILARDIDDRKNTAAMRLRLIRTYDIVQSRYSDKVRSRECVFHDEEGSYVHLNIPGNNVSDANSFIEGHVFCLMANVIGRVVHIFSPLDKLINGRPSKLIDFVIEDLKCNKMVDLKGGMYVCGKCGTHCDTPKLRYKIKLRVYDAKGSAPFLLWDREALELLGGITTEELKVMQPKVPTKIPKEIVSLVGRGMLFKINVERDRLEKRNLAFPVMQIKDDIAVVNEYCPGMLKGFFSDEEAESPLPNPLTQVSKGGANDSEAVKRRLLDEFSSTQVSKKKTHTVLIKVEKDSELAIDQNSQNIEI